MDLPALLTARQVLCPPSYVFVGLNCFLDFRQLLGIMKNQVLRGESCRQKDDEEKKEQRDDL